MAQPGGSLGLLLLSQLCDIGGSLWVLLYGYISVCIKIITASCEASAVIVILFPIVYLYTRLYRIGRIFMLFCSDDGPVTGTLSAYTLVTSVAGV